MAKRILYLGLDPTHYSSKDEVIHWPIIQVVPRPLSEPAIHQALCHFEHYSHIIVTSKTTVAILQDYLSQLKIGVQAWAQKVILAVGQVTAKHLQACGITPTIVAQEETAEGIIYELQQLSLEQAHVFWPHSARARLLIKEFLKTQGIRHTTCPLYDTIPQVPQTMPNLEGFDAIIFTSPSTVEAFLQIFGAFPSQVELVAIGPVTARFLYTAHTLV